MNDRVLQNIRCKRRKLPRRGPGQSPAENMQFGCILA